MGIFRWWYKAYDWLDKVSYGFLVAINWSTLSGIGNSKVARLTILMPVVGYLIVFNSSLSGWLKTNIPDREKVAPDYWDGLYDQNLTFLYFGLLVFGLGVSLYSATVPSQIKRFPRVEDYIISMDNIGTRNLIIGSFNEVIEMYFKNLEGEERSSMFDGRKAAFPGEVHGSLDRLTKEMFEQVDWPSDPEGEDIYGSGFYTGSGYFMAHELLETMFSGRRVDAIILYLMYDQVAKRGKDVFYIEHRALEFSRTWSRVFVFFLFSIGLTLTAFPTLLTAIIILKS